MAFGHFPAAFLYPLRLHRGFPLAFGHFPAAFLHPLSISQQPLRAFPSGCRLKRGNFQLLFLKGRIFVNIYKKAKEHLKMLKTTSGSSSSTDLSNNINFSQSQSHAIVPLKDNLLRKRELKELSLTTIWKIAF
jgi:hypothetical protein